MDLTKAYPFDFVEIEWRDASGDTGWKNLSEIKEEHTLVTSYGFLLRKTRHHYLIGSSLYFDDEEDEYAFGDRNHIPRGMVKSFRVLIPKNSPGADSPQQVVA